MADAPPTDLALDRYALVDVLGEGTTSTVFRAFDRDDELDVAIKVLSPGMSAHAAMRDRFLREAAMTAELSHANMVQVHDAGDADGKLYIVMDLVPGGTLEQVVELTGPIPSRKATSLLQQVLHALHYAHAKGVVHRDVNPGNIMLTLDGTPKVVDFGLGRALGRDPRVTTDPGSVLGTWGYMAPEQGIDSGHVDNRTDIYAAGATLYAVLTGRRPDRLFRVDDPHDVAFEGVPRPLVPVILKATQYQPDDRYPTAAAMAEALAEAHELLPPLTPEEEATIVVRPSAPDDTVMRKQIDLSNLVPPDEAKAERQRRRRAGREQRAREEAPTAQHTAVTPPPERPGLRDATPAQAALIAGAVVLALAMVWLAVS